MFQTAILFLSTSHNLSIIIIPFHVYDYYDHVCSLMIWIHDYGWWCLAALACFRRWWWWLQVITCSFIFIDPWINNWQYWSIAINYDYIHWSLAQIFAKWTTYLITQGELWIWIWMRDGSLSISRMVASIYHHLHHHPGRRKQLSDVDDVDDIDRRIKIQRS